MLNDVCQVQDCAQKKETHLTSAHFCLHCRTFGHGTRECGNASRLHRLQQLSLNDRLQRERHCEIPNCSNPQTHWTEAHRCARCGTLTADENHCRQAAAQNHMQWSALAVASLD